MTDILIRTKEDVLEHKMLDNEEFYWTLPGKPRKMTEEDEGKAKVMFTDGKNVYAEYTYQGWDPFYKGIVFDNYKKVNRPQPKTAPTRGFTYVN